MRYGKLSTVILLTLIAVATAFATCLKEVQPMGALISNVIDMYYYLMLLSMQVLASLIYFKRLRKPQAAFYIIFTSAIVPYFVAIVYLHYDEVYRITDVTYSTVLVMCIISLTLSFVIKMMVGGKKFTPKYTKMPQEFVPSNSQKKVSSIKSKRKLKGRV
jgi:peptidoglycan/LPS O-acetylase OafA/YrhL